MFTLWLCNVYTNKPVNEMVPVLEMEAVLDQIFFFKLSQVEVRCNGWNQHALAVHVSTSQIQVNFNKNQLWMKNENTCMFT